MKRSNMRIIHVHRIGHEGTVVRAVHRYPSGATFIRLYGKGLPQHEVIFIEGAWRYYYEKPWKRLPADLKPSHH